MVSKKVKHRKRSAYVTRKRERVRREILEAAQEVLTENGVEAVTLAAVAERLGMTKQALYHYYGSKEALMRALVATILDDEIETQMAALDAIETDDELLGVMIRTFYAHYIGRLEAFRTVYCRMQLRSQSLSTIDGATLREEVHPRTRHLFETLEARLAGANAGKNRRRDARLLAYTAWTSVLGLMTMISIADAADDPLAHPHDALLDTLVSAFGERSRT